MGSAKRKRLKERRQEVKQQNPKRIKDNEILFVTNSDGSIFTPRTKDDFNRMKERRIPFMGDDFILEPGNKESRRKDFMKMNYQNRIETFMFGEHDFCIRCGKDWNKKFNPKYGMEMYECECGEVMSIPFSGEI